MNSYFSSKSANTSHLEITQSRFLQVQGRTAVCFETRQRSGISLRRTSPMGAAYSLGPAWSTAALSPEATPVLSALECVHKSPGVPRKSKPGRHERSKHTSKLRSRIARRRRSVIQPSGFRGALDDAGDSHKFFGEPSSQESGLKQGQMYDFTDCLVGK